jgi:hypothetical protein
MIKNGNINSTAIKRAIRGAGLKDTPPNIELKNGLVVSGQSLTQKAVQANQASGGSPLGGVTVKD